VETYFFSKINNYIKLTCTFIFNSLILEFMFSNYIIFMLFIHVLINCYFYTNKYQFNTKYPNNIIILTVKLTLG